MQDDEELGFLIAASRAMPHAVRGVQSIEGIFKDDDSELGFVEAIGKAAGGLLKGVGKAFKKKKKKKPALPKAAAKPKSKVIQMPMTDIVGEVKKAASVGGDTAGAVKAIVASIPGPVHEVVLEALKAQSLDKVNKEKTMNMLAGQVDKKLKPKITAMLTALKAQDLQKRATYEHNKLVKKARFEDDTLGMLSKAYDKLAAIEARLGMSAVIPPSKINVYGSRNVLE